MLAGALLTGGAVGTALLGAGAATAQSSSGSDSSSSSESQSTAPNPSDAPPAFPDGRGGPHHGPGGLHGHADLGVAASTIGVSAADLRSALQSGHSIADVATAHGVDPQTVIDALVADAKSHLADAVASGRITQAQADQFGADLEQHITDFVNHTGAPGSAGCPNMGPDGSNGSSGSDSSSSGSSSSGTSFSNA